MRTANKNATLDYSIHCSNYLHRKLLTNVFLHEYHYTTAISVHMGPIYNNMLHLFVRYTSRSTGSHLLRYSQPIPRSLSSDCIHKVGSSSWFLDGFTSTICTGLYTARRGGGFCNPLASLRLVLLHVILLQRDSRGSAPQHTTGVKVHTTALFLIVDTVFSLNTEKFPFVSTSLKYTVLFFVKCVTRKRVVCAGC